MSFTDEQVEVEQLLAGFFGGIIEAIAEDLGVSPEDFVIVEASDLFDSLNLDSDPEPDPGVTFKLSDNANDFFGFAVGESDPSAKQCGGCDDCACQPKTVYDDIKSVYDDITGYEIPSVPFAGYSSIDSAEIPPPRVTGLEGPFPFSAPIQAVVNQRLRSIIEFGTDDENALDAIEILRDAGEID